MRHRLTAGFFLFASLLFTPWVQAEGLEGRQLSAWWAAPFAGLLLSIALAPLLAPGFWHRHLGKVAAGWSLAFLAPCALLLGLPAAGAGLVHALLGEYLPFVILIGALYVVAGGICVQGALRGSAAMNSAILAIGTLLASLMGTTGASMLLIRPLLRANAGRDKVSHVVVFFIFLVANAGGALTPLGDPPLFIGYLKGVDFFWTLRSIWAPTLFIWIALLLLFFCIDGWFWRSERPSRIGAAVDSAGAEPLRFIGKLNFLLLAVAIGLVLLSGFWKPGLSWTLAGTKLDLQNLVRDLGLLVVIGLSLRLTPAAARHCNEFSWEPMLEVARLFAAIFITITPVIAMLRAGGDGPFAFVVHAVTGANGQPVNAMYFWATGLLSAFLDNAPTYLVFFNTAGGDPAELMSGLAGTLAAISCGAVFMGAGSYIGNAPNMMVKSIAEQRGIRMPSFFAYMGWSGVILLPLFALMTVLFFR